MPTLQQVTHEDILEALGRLRAGEAHGFGAPTRYVLKYDGQLYPPKAVVGLAARRTHGRDLSPREFSSGIGPGQAVRLLRELGFDVPDAQPPGKPLNWAERLQVGHAYERSDIHQLFGGQEQSGIVTPRSAPVILIFSGPAGEKYGYRDGWEAETFWFSGQGQEGDMAFTSGNKAIRDHHADGREILLFIKRQDGCFLFEGPMVCTGHEANKGPDASGADRQVIRFSLARAANFSSSPTAELTRSATRLGAGRIQNPEERKAVEQYAVDLAKRYYEARNWNVEVKGKPYDLLCTNQGQELFVEVKGTSGGAARVSLTRNEVAHMRRAYPHTALFLVFGIQIVRGSDPIGCDQGEVREVKPWNIREEDLSPSQYDYTIPQDSPLVSQHPSLSTTGEALPPIEQVSDSS